MPVVKSPHTTITFYRNGHMETMGRKGHLREDEVASVLQLHGVSGPVVTRHHAGSMFGKPGKVVAVISHEVRG